MGSTGESPTCDRSDSLAWPRSTLLLAVTCCSAAPLSTHLADVLICARRVGRLLHLQFESRHLFRKVLELLHLFYKSLDLCVSCMSAEWWWVFNMQFKAMP